jgi:putative membrane protein
MMLHDMGWGGWAVGCAVMVAVWSGLFVLVLRSGRTQPPRQTTAEAILDERLARGELTVDDYRAARAALERR